MILVYVQHINPRVLYSFRLIFTAILSVQVKITSNKDDYEKTQGPRINYSPEKLEGLTIIPDSLLFETGIRVFEPKIIMVNGLPCLFPTHDDSDLPFDIFAAAFFMVTRYEEYFEQPLDNHGRIMASESIAYKNGFLDIPVVDEWAYMIKSRLKTHYPNFIFPDRHYRHIPTIDIDIAFAYRHHGLIRFMGAILNKLVRGNLKELKQHIKILIFKEKDPYDVFDQLQEWFSRFRLQPVFFFLVGDYGQYDKNLNARHSAMQHLIHRIGRKFSIGIHPSYASNFDYNLFQEEIHLLAKIKGKKVARSRQHFLKLTIPSTYQWLMQCNIEKDYSMGYASHPGFRAGTCTPFLFYDISTERETSLSIFPFQVMDGTFIDYQQVSPAEATQKIREIKERVQRVDGTFISLWHNVSLSEYGNWKNWSKVYTSMLEDNY